MGSASRACGSCSRHPPRCWSSPNYGTVTHVLPVTGPESSVVTGGSSASGGFGDVRTIYVVLACGIFQWIVVQAFLWIRIMHRMVLALPDGSCC